MNDPTRRAQAIKETLTEKLSATHVSVHDVSTVHSNHPGARNGGGHFQVLVVSERFAGLSRVAAQRLVYEALAELMVSEIHALQMQTLTPERWAAGESAAGD